MIIAHPWYQNAEDDLRRALAYFEPGHMIFLIGPSGVGKTTLRRAVMRERFGQPQHWGAGRVPLIEAFATLPRNSFFSSKELAIDLLNQLHTPSLQWLQPHGESDKTSTEILSPLVEPSAEFWQTVAVRPNMTEGQCWRSFKLMLRARHCRYVCLDQATALLVNHRNTEPAQHTQNLMAMAEEAGVMFIMTGVPAIVGLWGTNGELRRRVTPVWMAPYSAADGIDGPYFLRLLRTFETRFEFDDKNVLWHLADDIRIATAGVYAEVEKLLNRAERLACRRAHPVICEEDIKSSFYNHNDLTNLWNDIKSFEKARQNADVTEFSELLGIKRAGRKGRRAQ